MYVHYELRYLSPFGGAVLSDVEVEMSIDRGRNILKNENSSTALPGTSSKGGQVAIIIFLGIDLFNHNCPRTIF